jgi:glutamate-1-semialdehyde 2,1-aminomutase
MATVGKLTAHERFERQYAERTPRSLALYAEALEYLPGGVPGSAGYRPPHPLYVREARGPFLWDVDDNEYIDLLIGGGPNILGHSPPAVVEAVRAQAERGTVTIAPPENVIEMARKIRGHMPHVERIRFVHTGSEAVHIALRAARAFTGRTMVGKFEGNFHGGYDNELVSGMKFSGPANAPESIADCAGIPPSVLADTLVLPFNDAEATVALIEQHASELAAVVVEPVGGTWLGGVVAETPFLQALRAVTEQHGIILIFDEVITGFRVALGGATELTGVVPDLVTLAKAIGGGYPLGAFGGRADIMERVLSPATDPEDARNKIFQSGTFQSNLISLTAGLAMLGELEKPGVHAHMTALGDRLRDGFVRIATDVGFDVQAVGQGPIFGVYFSREPIRTIRDVAASDRSLAATFFLGLVANGIYITPYHLGFANASQTEAVIDRALEIAEMVFTQMRQSA